MVERKYNTVKEVLFWSYANLAMAHTAVEKNQDKYNTFNYMIRAKLYKGLVDGSMNIRTLFDDEKVKLLSGHKCSYCGSENNLALDHIFPRKLGGKDEGDNLIYACKACNSSKGKKDLMEWMLFKKDFPPLLILRRYLKIIIQYCIKENLMELSIEEIKSRNMPFPFNIDQIPLNFLEPKQLKLLT